MPTMNDIDQVRLYIGDTDPDEPYLNDDSIAFLLSEAGNDVLQASVDCLEVIINQIALLPSRWSIGDASETRATVEDLERRLQDLRIKVNTRKNKAVPIILHSGRKDWCEFEKIFGDH